MIITLQHFIILSVILFVIGIVGAIARRNVLTILMSIELMITAANLSLIAFARWNLVPQGKVIALFILAIAAAGVAVGLGIAIAAFRNKPTLDVEEFSILKG